MLHSIFRFLFKADSILFFLFIQIRRFYIFLLLSHRGSILYLLAIKNDFIFFIIDLYFISLDKTDSIFLFYLS